MKKIPWLSSIVLLLTYGAFGWIYTSWGVEAIERGKLLSQLETDLALSIVHGLGVMWIVSIALVFTAPISLITISLNSWLNSDLRAFISIFLGAFAFTLIVQNVDFFARFLILLAAALLFKLDLQLAGYRRWISWLILTFFCLLGFVGGILAFDTWGL